MPCKCIYKLDFNVLTMVNEGPQGLIIDALMINVYVTCSDSQESKWENLYTNIPHPSIAQIGAISRIHNVRET